MATLRQSAHSFVLPHNLGKGNPLARSPLHPLRRTVRLSR